MVDEVLFMEVRVFRQFLERFHMTAKDAYEIFEANGIWNYIEDCYGILHMSGDECVLDDIQEILQKNGILLKNGVSA